jgi:hypothetical protein
MYTAITPQTVLGETSLTLNTSNTLQHAPSCMQQSPEWELLLTSEASAAGGTLTGLGSPLTKPCPHQ